MGGREKLDNLIFVVNCNLQRLDGPVRGNSKIIQELEGSFRGAGWNVIKVVWGRLWDPLFANDGAGLLQQRMNEVVDGEYQNYKAKGGGYTREHFFGKHPELAEMVEKLSDDDIMRLNRGGHDPFKVYAAYHAAVNHTGEPTVILAKTVKGYGMGDAGEAENDTHSVKKLNLDELKMFRDRFDIPLTDSELQDVPFYRPADDSPEIKYLHAQRADLGGPLPRRILVAETLEVPPLSAFKTQLEGAGERLNSTTMGFVRMLATLLRDKQIGPRIVPIVPDEARTFGMEGMFRQLGIYSSVGQLYEPEDSGEIAAYRESIDGQVIEAGISEAGAFSAWLAAATSYTTNQYTLIPFYIFYSMFGFQRIGDLAWAAGDSQARGFLLGGTSGRTTLNGEGLQHQDGHGHLLAATIPNCVSYDPCYTYELAVIVQEGLRRMIAESENVFYYITVMNEAYLQPPLPGEGEDESVTSVTEGILKGMYRLRVLKGSKKSQKVRLLGAGAILREVEAAAEILQQEYDLTVEIFSVTSFTELAREGQDVQRWNLLNPEQTPKECYVQQQLIGDVPVIVASDYMKTLAEQIRGLVSADMHVLGTDGFGRSDTRESLRHFFEVDRKFVVLAALKSLADIQRLPVEVVAKARDELGIDPDKANPRLA
jgi:pyruvate dehydrogenase E1 component